ncbi:SDR family NAD(P)-dependent oxidoreductase [Microbacterium lacticum]
MSDRPLAVVTGATGGIGRRVCLSLAESGYDLVAQFHVDAEGAASLEAAVTSLGCRCRTVAADLSSGAGIDAVVQAVDDGIGRDETIRVRALVNNAAKLLGPSFDTATLDDFDAYFAINTRAAFFLAQRLVRVMPAGASIVNISSASAHFSSPGDIVYAMSKAAVESMTANMAEAVASRGVRVNAIVPGFTNNGHPAFDDERTRTYMSSFSVLGGVSDPAHVAAAVLFLVSDASARTTGSILDVSGGSTLGARGVRAHSVRDLL